MTKVCASNGEGGSTFTQKGEGVVMVFLWPVSTRLMWYAMMPRLASAAPVHSLWVDLKLVGRQRS